MSTGQQATRINNLGYYQNKDWCGSLQILPQTILLFWKLFFFTAAHLYQSIDKCGGEIAKLATSSHKKAIETSE